MFRKPRQEYPAPGICLRKSLETLEKRDSYACRGKTEKTQPEAAGGGAL